MFSPLPVPGEMIQFDEHIFQMGWFNHQLVYIYISNLNPLRYCLVRRFIIQIPGVERIFFFRIFVLGKRGKKKGVDMK